MNFDAVVESIDDPLRNGRVQIRVFGLHTDNTSLIPTEALPWARVLMPNTSSSMSGNGSTPRLLPGTWVSGYFSDAEQQYPVILGTFHGIPVKKHETSKSIDEISFASAGVTTDDTARAKQGQEPRETPPEVKPTTANNADDLTNMPLVPPAGTPNFDKASANIKLIVEECLSKGIKSRRAISSILGVIGGECMWIPVKGNYKYSAARLVEVFPSVFPTLESAKPYEYRDDLLPEKLYGVGTPKGKVLGNTESGDGTRFIDRGFLQLIGRYNYNRYKEKAGIDIVSNPELLLSSSSISAKVSIAYVLDRVKVDQYSDSYFEEVKKEVGHNTPDIATKKRKFYDYFMGGAVVVTNQDQNKEDVVNEQKPEDFSIEKENSALIYGNSSGFRDPSGQYPLFIDEQDLNRLARGEKIKDTIVEKKNQRRVKGIESVGKKWDEQISPYNTTYPFNQVIQSPGGHVIEMDDTPNAERLHIYHKSGSYVEIDNTGSRTTRIVGSSYEIIDKNGHLFINGTCHVTVGGNANINVGGDLNARVSGDANLGVGGTLNGHASEINLQSSGDISMRAGGKIALDASTVHFNDGIASSAGVEKPSMSSGTRPIQDPVPNRLSDSKAVLYELEGEKGGDALIAESVANGTISPDEASRKPVEGSKSTVTGENKKPLPADCATIASMTSFPDTLRLSPNFNLGQVSSRAAVSNARVQDQGDLSKEEIVCNLQFLCLNALESIKTRYPNMFVTSGFRLIGSNADSQHPRGQAADIQFRGVSKADYFEIAKELVTNIPVFDQFLLEYSVTANNPWIHISCTRTGNRRQVMTFNNHRKYKDGLIDLS